MSERDQTQTPPRKRRRQEDRSEATRQRLIDGAISCIETEGYAGTTVSKIVKHAQVSRGSHVYHFPSKAALIEAAAQQVVRRVYVQLGEALSDLSESDDRLRTIALTCWRTVFQAPEHSVLLELVMASRNEEELAQVMLRSWSRGYALVKHAAEYYFEPVDPNISIASVIAQLQWLLRGMAMDRHIVKDERLFEEHLEVWCEIMRTWVRPREGISSPPPRPPKWESK